ncbi:hypothetical protein NQ318_003583 [Aromia moschata]|uniref:Small ribosomal subunit protein eS6 n=1 Tax=Aromia moschata TaxID=1265417 RepID=A0AAV8YVD8_9CUCU|nr:hypothetical protein NQ318_003583 [Aromia moschata]
MKIEVHNREGRTALPTYQHVADMPIHTYVLWWQRSFHADFVRGRVVCAMKLNVSFPATGCQKLFEVVDEHKIRIFYEKRMGQEVEADTLGDEWKGYILKITGGNDKQGFPMKQGVLTNSRVRLLLSKGHSCYRPRRTGEREEKISPRLHS